MLEIKEGKATISSEVKLTQRQQAAIKGMEPSEALRYVFSIQGIQTGRGKVSVPRYRVRGADSLEVKGRGHYRNWFRDLLRNNGSENHTPTRVRHKASRWVGVEIECIIPNCGPERCENCDSDGEVTLEDSDGNEYYVTCRSCDGTGWLNSDDSDASERARDLVQDALRSAGVTRASVKDDGSIETEDDDENGTVEVTLLFNSARGFGPLRKTCKVLNDLGAEVNASCGLHVHLDQGGSGRDIKDIARLGNKFERYLPLLEKIVAPSRLDDNQYCQLGVSGMDEDDCRYYAVNLTSFEHIGTVEIRLHHGTANFEKISNWVQLLHKIEDSSDTATPEARPSELLRELKLSDKLNYYVRERWNRFYPNECSHPDQTSFRVSALESVRNSEQATA